MCSNDSSIHIYPASLCSRIVFSTGTMLVNQRYYDNTVTMLFNINSGNRKKVNFNI